MAVEGTGIAAVTAAISGAIRKAARATGASFDYLLAAAKVESNFDPNARAPTSSARGLFQFIDQTWLATLKNAGPALGYGRYADAIVQANGGYAVPDPGMRDLVMNLRHDPAANAAMAGAFTNRNRAELQQRIGRAPSGGELYIAHVLGSNGAARLIGVAAQAPRANAAELLPGAAEANRSIFFDRQGHPRSAGEVYSVLVARYDSARAQTLGLASGAPAQGVRVTAPDTAGLTHVLADLNDNAAGGDIPAPSFRSLFQSTSQRGPVAPVVGALWGADAPPQLAPDGASGSPNAKTTAPSETNLFGLFPDNRPPLRGLFDVKS